MFSLRGHGDWVNQVRIDLPSRTILSASDDCQIRLWDLDTRKCLRTFVGHMGHVQQVLPLPADFEPDLEVLDGGVGAAAEAGAGTAGAPPDNSDAASTTSSSSRRSSTPAVVVGGDTNARGALPAATDDPRALYGSAFVSEPSRPLPPAYIVSGGLDATLRLWSTATGRCLKTWFGHLEGIWALQGDTLRVVTGANDGMVKVIPSFPYPFSANVAPLAVLGPHNVTTG
jgi:F-box/WD-40 domain protein MET30